MAVVDAAIDTVINTVIDTAIFKLPRCVPLYNKLTYLQMSSAATVDASRSRRDPERLPPQPCEHPDRLSKSGAEMSISPNTIRGNERAFTHNCMHIC